MNSEYKNAFTDTYTT